MLDTALQVNHCETRCYSHVLPDMQREAVDRLGAMLS